MSMRFEILVCKNNPFFFTNFVSLHLLILFMKQLENTYCESFYIPSYLIDYKLKLSPQALFNVMQEAAVNHVAKIGVGWDNLHPNGEFWALSKMDIEFIRRPQWKDTVTINTWGKKHDFLVQPRDFLIESTSGETLIKATSNWVILNQDGKPQLLENYDNKLHNQLDFEVVPHPATRIKPLNGAVLSDIYHPVVYTDLDMNQHANNSAYVVWIMNHFGFEFHQTHEIESLSLNYLAQTRPNDRYTIVQQEVAPNVFVASIIAEIDKAEVCRIQTKWRCQ